MNIPLRDVAKQSANPHVHDEWLAIARIIKENRGEHDTAFSLAMIATKELRFPVSQGDIVQSCLQNKEAPPVVLHGSVRHLIEQQASPPGARRDAQAPDRTSPQSLPEDDPKLF